DFIDDDLECRDWYSYPHCRVVRAARRGQDRPVRLGCRPGRGDHALLGAGAGAGAAAAATDPVADIPGRPPPCLTNITCAHERTKITQTPSILYSYYGGEAALRNKAAVHHEKRGWARVQMGWTNGRGYCSLMSTRGVTGALSDCHGSCWAVRLSPSRAQFWPSLHCPCCYSWPRTASQHEMQTESTPDRLLDRPLEATLPLSLSGPLPLTFDAPRAVQHQRAAGET
ncbi:hypothetical protein V8C44DRAFT_362894, partial [Trichoderma aethiopicum]